MRDYSGIIEKIMSARRALIFTHANMDGDALGSASALALLLRQLGKEAYIMAEKPCPEYLSFLDMGLVTLEKPYEHDLSIAVDLGNDDRLEGLKECFYSAETNICIDHHLRTEGFCGNYAIVDPDAAAAGCLVYELYKKMDQPVSIDAARLLYAAVCTDTGCFRFSNTDLEAMTMAGELISMGIDHGKLCSRLFDSFPLCQLKLESLVLERAQIFADGKAVLSYCTEEDYEACGALPEHSETCIDRLRSIEGVEIAAMLKKRDNAYKLSLRSKEYADVSRIAASFNGGGHVRAAGATIVCSLEESMAKVKEAVSKQLETDGKCR